MVHFDGVALSKIEISKDRVDYTNAGIQKIRKRFVDEIKIRALPPNALIRSMAQAFFQGQVRRGVMFIEGGYEAYLAGRGLVSYACARAVYETVACVFDFCDKLTDHIASGDFEKIGNFLHNRLYAARMAGFVSKEDGFDNTAPNVLTQIERLSKNLRDMKTQYEYLCEKTHPNGLGALGYFWTSGDVETSKKFTNGDENELVLRMLFYAGEWLATMEEAISLMEEKLSEPTSLLR